MMFKSHLAIAAGGYFVALSSLSNHFEYVTTPMLIGGLLTLIGCIFPDIDHKNSFIGKRLRFISVPISFVFGHRGITHSLVPLVFLIIFYGHQTPAWLMWIYFGYFMHLIGDFITDAGIPLLYPITNKRFRFLLVTKTNSIGESILVVGFLVACLLWVFL